ncbi:MAG: DedA family protein [Fimbriimonadales bacterium]|nr:DedA family protein [Fimbriimonadales bacterium]
MDLLSSALDYFIHLDRHLGEVLRQYSTGTYAILFLIVFCETGLVVTPFLPGDSLLFAAGVLASRTGELHPWALAAVFFTAALCGDNVNYLVGRSLGPRLFRNEDSRVFKRRHLVRTEAFFERYGAKTIVIARFVPIVRTFAPFVAGMGRMAYRRFLAFSVLGACLWVGLFVFGGFYFGTAPIVERNFTVAILAVIAISMLPAAWEVLQHVLRRRRAAAAGSGSVR